MMTARTTISFLRISHDFDLRAPKRKPNCTHPTFSTISYWYDEGFTRNRLWAYKSIQDTMCIIRVLSNRVPSSSYLV